MADDVIKRMINRMENTFQDFEQTFREFERNLGTDMDVQAAHVPVDITETDDTITIVADLPGIEKNQIDVDVTTTTLQVHARDEREVTEEGKDYVRQERQSRNYQRSIRLPAPVDPSSADATYRDGVLTIDLEKKADTNGTSISIN